MFQSLLSYPSKYTLLVKIGNGPAFGFSHGVAPAETFGYYEEESMKNTFFENGSSLTT